MGAFFKWSAEVCGDFKPLNLCLERPDFPVVQAHFFLVIRNDNIKTQYQQQNTPYILKNKASKYEHVEMGG